MLKSRSVSLFSNTQSPYAPTTVPIGILMRLTAESTIPSTRDHGLKLSKTVAGDQARQCEEGEKCGQGRSGESENRDRDRSILWFGSRSDNPGDAAHREKEERRAPGACTRRPPDRRRRGLSRASAFGLPHPVSSQRAAIRRLFVVACVVVAVARSSRCRRFRDRPSARFASLRRSRRDGSPDAP